MEINQTLTDTYQLSGISPDYSGLVRLNTSIYSSTVSLYLKAQTLQGLLDSLPASSVILQEWMIQAILSVLKLDQLDVRRFDIVHSLEHLKQKNAIYAPEIMEYQALMKKEVPFPETSLELRDLFEKLLPSLIEERRYETGTFHAGIRIDLSCSLSEETICSNLDRFLEQKETMPQIIWTILFQALFSRLHPFYSGNVRMNWFLSALSFSQCLSVPVALLAAPAFEFQGDQWKWMVENIEGEDFSQYCTWFLSVLETYLSDQIDYMKEESEQLALFQKGCLNSHLKGREMKFLMILGQYTLFEMDGATKKELMKLLKCSLNTVNNYIDRMKEAVVIKKDQKINRYTLNRTFVDWMIGRANRNETKA